MQIFNFNICLKNPNFDENTLLNDISLFILSEPVELTNEIQIACLPVNSFPPYNVNAYASGWVGLSFKLYSKLQIKMLYFKGVLRSGGTLPYKLYNVQLTIYSPSACSAVSNYNNWNSQICCGDYNGGKDTCQGDSGGGLYVFDPTINSYVVSGITSYGNGIPVIILKCFLKLI